MGGDFNCGYNPIDEIWYMFRNKLLIELLNDYDIFRGENIILDRLNDFLINIGNNPVKAEEIKNYKVI